MSIKLLKNKFSQEAEAGGSPVPGQPDLYSEILSQKKNLWIGGVGQAVKCLFCQHLLCKHKSLSSNPSRTKKKNIYIYIYL
jgi:hypothetical protein